MLAELLMHRLSCRLACAAAFLTLAVSVRESLAQTPPVTVLVDGSGSMQGFFATGAMEGLVRALGAARRYRFEARSDGANGITSRVVPFDPAVPATGGMTLLWRGLDEYLRDARPGEVIAMVTDNVQDAGTLAAEQQDVRAFYRELAGSAAISHVFIIPIRRPFSGLLYGRAGRGSIGLYQDERALVVYLIGYRQSSDAVIESTARRIAERIGSTPIRMKPYRTAPVLVEVDTAGTRRFTGRDTCGFLPLVPEPGEPNVLSRRKPVDEGRPFGGRFVIKLRSNLEGVSLSKPRIAATITDTFRLRSFELKGAPVIVSDPPHLETALEPGDSTSVRVNLCFRDGVRFRWSRDVFLRLVPNSSPTGRYEGGVRVQLTLLRTDLRLAERVREEYSVTDERFFESSSREFHRRIFGLEYAFRALASDTVRVEKQADQRLRFPLRYPVWPTIVAILALLVALAIVAWIARAVARPTVYRIVEEAPGIFHIALAEARSARAVQEASGPEGYLSMANPPRSAAPGGRAVSVSRFRGVPLFSTGREGAMLRKRLVGGAVVVARPGFVIDGTLRHKAVHPAGTTLSVSAGEKPDRSRGRPDRPGPRVPDRDRGTADGADPGAFLPR